MKYLKIVDRNKAETGVRFANYILDRITLYSIIFIFHITLGIIYGITNFEPISTYLNYIEGLNRIEDIIYTTSLFFLYYYLMEYYTNGRTIGKFITGTRAISIDGNKATQKQLLYRTLSRAVPFNALSFFGETGWHDSWSDTRVIKVKSYNEDVRQKADLKEIGEKS